MLLLLSLITSSLVANSKWAVIELKDDGGEVEEDQVDLGEDGRLAQDQNIHEKEGDPAAGDYDTGDPFFDDNSFFDESSSSLSSSSSSSSSESLHKPESESPPKSSYGILKNHCKGELPTALNWFFF